MAFTPHTKKDIAEMLSVIGIDSIEGLFKEIPESLLTHGLNPKIVPESISEMTARRELTSRARKDATGLCFIGAGAYEHHIPAAVWDITSRGEFLTAYTPYQAEASQGTLQLLYEYQTMMASLMGLAVSNASLYDGASALAEAILMAVRAQRNQTKRILVPKNLHPHYREVIKTIVTQQGIEIVELSFDRSTGCTPLEALTDYQNQEIAALVIQHPNFFGSLEDIDALTDWAHAKDAKVIAVVNPTAMAILKEPGQWGKQGADIACGEGQSLGVPLASGGPYFGFMCCKQELVRQMPGRLVGRTQDLDGKPGFVLTLQAREQHIRRSKATSNICTNQGLLVTAATIYMSLLGPYGLAQVAKHSHANASNLIHRVLTISGVTQVFTSPFFHEFVIGLPCDVDLVVKELAKQGLQAGYSLKKYYPELGNALLVCVTETKTEGDLDKYCQLLARVLSQQMHTEHNQQVDSDAKFKLGLQSL